MAEQLNLLIEKAAAIVGNRRQLALQMGHRPQVLYDWAHGFKTPSDEKIEQLAEIAGEDAGKWVALMAVMKTGNQRAIEFAAKAWQHT